MVSNHGLAWYLSLGSRSQYLITTTTATTCHKCEQQATSANNGRRVHALVDRQQRRVTGCRLHTASAHEVRCMYAGIAIPCYLGTYGWCARVACFHVSCLVMDFCEAIPNAKPMPQCQCLNANASMPMPMPLPTRQPETKPWKRPAINHPAEDANDRTTSLRGFECCGSSQTRVSISF